MKKIWKHIIVAVCAVLTIGYLVFGVYMSYAAVPAPVCKNIHVIIADAHERMYITEAEIRQLITTKDLNPSGKILSNIDLQQIEKKVRQHSMIRTAECYVSMQGDLCVYLTQRVPIVRVVTAAESYFVDSDRRVMPIRESVKTPVLMVTGEVSKRMSTHEVSDLALWLQQNDFWKERVHRVEVQSPRMIHIFQPNGMAKIIVGSWNGMEQKMNKLQHWYEAGQGVDYPLYRVVDIRYKGQVIGIKQAVS